MNKNFWAVSISYSLLTNLTPVILGFLGFFVLVRILSPENFGVWALFQVVINLIELSRQALLHNGTIKHFTSQFSIQKVKSASLIINISFGLTTVLLIYLISFLFVSNDQNSVLIDMLKVYAFTTLIHSSYLNSNILLTYRSKFKEIFLSNLSKQLFFLLSILTLYSLNTSIGLLQLAYLNLTAVFVGSVTSVVYSRKDWTVKLETPISEIKALLNYGKYVFGTGLSGILSNSLDQLMLGGMISNSAVAIYNTCNRLPNLVNTPANAIANVLFPQSAKMDANNKSSISKLYSDLVGANLALIIPGIIVIFLFPKLILFLIAGDHYAEYFNILRIMIFTTLFVPATRQFGTIMDSLGQPKINFYITLFSAFSNIIFNWILISKWGLSGAVWGTLISNSISFLIILGLLKRMINLSPSSIFHSMINFYIQIWALMHAKLNKK